MNPLCLFSRSRCTRRLMCGVVVAGFAMLSVPRAASALPPNSPEVARAIDRAIQHVRTQVGRRANGARDGFFVYAMIKGGMPKDDPAAVAMLQRISAKFKDSKYAAMQDGWYEAACDIMALEAIDPVRYRAAIQIIAAQLVAAQNDAGGWNYPHDRNRGGDMSVTQYAILGLWAAERAGVKIPPETWDRAAAWMVTSAQAPNGGFVYQPSRGMDVRHSMTAAGVSSLYICRMFLYPNAPAQLVRVEPAQPQAAPQETPAERQKRLGIRWGVLEPLPVETPEEEPEQPQPAAPQPVARARTPLVRIDQSIAAGLQWLSQNFEIEKPTGWPKYYLYGIERLGALANLRRIGNHDWYDEGSTYLVREQKDDGSWYSSEPGEWEGIGACFAILFLSQSTRKTLNLEPQGDPVAGGWLRGERLPEDLSNAQVDQAGRIQQVKLSGPFEELLAELAKGEAAVASAAQAAIVEEVRNLDRERLIGQKDRLIELARHRNPDVRRTAIWALGRTEDLDLVPLLLEALRDPNVDVNVEAYNALCFLSRRPEGIGLPGSPYAELAIDATEVQRQQARDRWREQAHADWSRWYFAVRPYDQRDDLAERARAER